MNEASKRARQWLSAWLLNMAVRVEPKSPACERAVVASEPVSATIALVSAAAMQTAGDLRRLADSVDAGHVTGFRFVWYGGAHRPDVWFHVPNAIGEA